MPKGIRKLLCVQAVLVLVMVMAFAGCAPSEPAEGDDEGLAAEQILYVALEEDPDILDPHHTSMAVASTVMDLIYDRLVYIDSDGLPQGWLAESWDIQDDGKTVVFELREGINFHDGTPVNAEAVAFTFNRHIDPDEPAAQDWIGPLDRAEATGEYQVTLYYKSIHAPMFTQLATAYLGIMSPTAIQEHGADYGRNPVGSGPMKLAEWRPVDRIILERNEEYRTWRTDVENQGPWHLDQIVFRIVPEAGTRVAAMETGELHVAQVPPEEFPYMDEDPQFQTKPWREGTNITYIEFNYDRPPFDDVRMRQAVAYAVDIESIVEGALGGFGEPNWNPLPIGVAGYDADIGREYGYQHDPDKAVALLEQVGMTDTTGSGYVDVDGKDLELLFWIYPVDHLSRAAEMIKEQLSAVGLKMEIQTLELGTLIARIFDGEQDFNIMRFTWADPVLLTYCYRSDQWLYSNPDVDELLNLADATLEPEQRLEYVRQVQIEILKDAATVPLYTTWVLDTHRAEVQGLGRGFQGGLLYHDVRITE